MYQSQNKEPKKAPPKNLENLRKYILFLLSKRDYSTAILREKSLTKTYLPQDVETVLKEFTDANYINDERLAQNLVTSYLGQKGKVWITQKLMLKKIPREIIEAQFKDPEVEINKTNDWFEARIKSKYNLKTWQNLDPAIKNKIMQYIARQGFSQPWDIMREWLENEENQN
jgi:regulatory protein